MPGAERTLAILVTAKDLASGALNKVNKEIAGVAKSATAAGRAMAGAKGLVAQGAKLGLGFLGVTTAARLFTDVIGDAVGGAIKEAAGIAKLNAALKANVGGWDGSTAAIEKFAKASMNLAFADDEVRDSVARLVVATKNQADAIKLSRLAMDLARLKEVDLATASGALAKAWSGSTRELKALGIVLDEGASKTEVLAAIQKAAAGQADAYSNTIAGAAEKAKIRFDELTESIAEKALPAINTALTGLDYVLSEMSGDKSVEHLTVKLELLKKEVGGWGDQMTRIMNLGTSWRDQAIRDLETEIALIKLAADETERWERLKGQVSGFTPGGRPTPLKPGEVARPGMVGGDVGSGARQNMIAAATQMQAAELQQRAANHQEKIAGILGGRTFWEAITGRTGKRGAREDKAVAATEWVKRIIAGTVKSSIPGTLRTLSQLAKDFKKSGDPKAAKAVEKAMTDLKQFQKDGKTAQQKTAQAARDSAAAIRAKELTATIKNDLNVTTRVNLDSRLIAEQVYRRVWSNMANGGRSGGPSGDINCLAAGTLIDTPFGEMLVESLNVGDPIWTVNREGKRVGAHVKFIGSKDAPATHQVVRLTMEDGRVVLVSPAHPLVDGRTVGDLGAGDYVTGFRVATAALEPYSLGRTYDVRPVGVTGAYWADGILLASTL